MLHESCNIPLVTLFNKRGVQMIIGVYGFLSNVKRSSVNVFITPINSSVAEASTCTMKYFSDASVLNMFLTLDIRGTNDISNHYINELMHSLV